MHVWPFTNKKKTLNLFLNEILLIRSNVEKDPPNGLSEFWLIDAKSFMISRILNCFFCKTCEDRFRIVCGILHCPRDSLTPLGYHVGKHEVAFRPTSTRQISDLTNHRISPLVFSLFQIEKDKKKPKRKRKKRRKKEEKKKRVNHWTKGFHWNEVQSTMIHCNEIQSIMRKGTLVWIRGSQGKKVPHCKKNQLWRWSGKKRKKACIKEWITKLKSRRSQFQC